MDILISSNESISKLFSGTKQDQFNKFQILTKGPTKNIHYASKTINNCLCFWFGNIYESDKDILNLIFKSIIEKKPTEILNIDGEFICGMIDKKNDIHIISEREGMIPLYYKKSNDGWIITSDQQVLFFDYCENDINYHAVNDFLRFGCLIGDETFSNLVKRIRGGTYSLFDHQGVQNHNRFYMFHYIEEQSIDNMNELIEVISEKYKNAIKKRTQGIENNTCVFMSGGMDSRFLLAESNLCLEEKVKAYCFGQDNSEEVNIARLCAELNDNPFEWIKLAPGDFVKNVADYEKIVCGSDMFPQSYIINVAENLEEENFITGFCMDAYMGGTFLDEEAILYDGELEEFIKDHLKLIKMNVFSRDELETLCIDKKSAKFLEYDITGLLEEAKQYKGLSTADSIQAFAIENRAKNLVLQREITPAKNLDCRYVSCDKDFLAAVARIPAKYRLNHKFYQELFKLTLPEYAKIVYNNTMLPVLAPVEMWKDGARNESQREKEFEKIIATYNSDHDDKIYYPHYYSDFNGYSRYDSDWKKLFEKYLFAVDAFITSKIFDADKIKMYYNEHLSSKKNRRKELVYLTSLEIFFKTMLREYNEK